MLYDHGKVGIAQIVFYVPVFASAIYLLSRHGRPRMAWILLLTYSLFRLTGGIVVIIAEQNPSNTGLEIANIILLGVGIIPLIVATIGLLRIIVAIDFTDQPLLSRVLTYLRISFLPGVGLLVAGGVSTGNYNSSSSVDTGHKLAEAGYIVIAAILGMIFLFQFWLLGKRSQFSTTSMIIIKGVLLAIPFLTVRIVYACLAVFEGYSPESQWNTLEGSIAIYVVMGLVMEYIVVALYTCVGLFIPPVNTSKGEPGAD